jgi:hypothetical protein
MAGGYVVFILMTKVPGKQLSRKDYWGLSLAERDAIRAAFRVALQ